MFFTIIIFVAVLSLLVFVHELGHFLTARRLGVKAEEFGFGFPPRAIGVYKDKNKRWRWLRGNQSLETLAADPEKAPADTVYSINWILAGGFVKIKGENGDGKLESDSFASQAAWKRALILVAGVVMNVILAWFLLSVGYLAGMPQDLDEVGKRAKVLSTEVLVIEVAPDSPAAIAGLEPGMSIVAVEGETVTSVSFLQESLAERVDQPTTILVSTLESGPTELAVTPQFYPEIDRGGIGIGIYGSGTVRYPLFDALWQGAKTTGWYLKLIGSAFYYLIADLIAGESVEGQVGGPVAIAKYTGEVARFGIIYLLQFIAILSLNLAIINILPIPALDGGRLIFLLVEKLKGRPMRQEIEGVLHLVFFWALIALIVFVTYKDIVNLF